MLHPFSALAVRALCHNALGPSLRPLRAIQAQQCFQHGVSMLAEERCVAPQVVRTEGPHYDPHGHTAAPHLDAGRERDRSLGYPLITASPMVQTLPSSGISIYRSSLARILWCSSSTEAVGRPNTA